MRTSRREPAPQASQPEANQAQASQLKTSQRGQALPIFVASVILFIGLLAVVADVSWYWVNSLRVQRAADAAALAGVVWLPGDPTTGRTQARAEATKNGYNWTAPNITVTADPDLSNDRRMNVTISAPVPTFFMRYFGIANLTARRTAKAEFILPVPMGSPLNYYGIGCLDTNNINPLTEPQCISVANNSNGPSGVSNAPQGTAVTGGTAPSQLSSMGFWGVAFTKGGDSRNGDAYLPTQVSGPTGPNPDYDPAGYGYTVEIPAGGGGSVWLFDPGFCGMPVLGSGRAGTGDEWTGNLGGSNPAAVTTYFNLWDTRSTPFDLTDDTLVYGSKAAGLFQNMLQVDTSGAHGSGAPQYAVSGSITRCDRSTDANYAYHLKWWQMPPTLVEGTYRLQVTSTDVDLTTGGTTVLNAGVNSTVGAANRFGIEVTSAAGNPRVYGGGRMASYANIQSGTQRFYLAQIDAVHAGKTMQIDLYDPGDVGGGAFLQILDPDNINNTSPYLYQAATFSFTSKSKATGAAGPSGTNVKCVQTNRASGPPGGVVLPAECAAVAVYDNTGSRFDAYWLTITVPLKNPVNPAIPYGANGLTPSGETQSSWWKIQYWVGGGNDTTTWRVSIRGNPVHLIVP